MTQRDLTALILKMNEDIEADKLIEEINQIDEISYQKAVREVRAMLTSPSSLVAQTNLMAAASDELSVWFSQPISFHGVGMCLDIRKVIGSETEVELNLFPLQGAEAKMHEALKKYLGLTVEIKLMINSERGLVATAYVDDEGLAVEGMGHLRIETLPEHAELSLIVKKQE